MLPNIRQIKERRVSGKCTNNQNLPTFKCVLEWVIKQNFITEMQIQHATFPKATTSSYSCYQEHFRIHTEIKTLNNSRSELQNSTLNKIISDQFTQIFRVQNREKLCSARPMIKSNICLQSASTPECKGSHFTLSIVAHKVKLTRYIEIQHIDLKQTVILDQLFLHVTLSTFSHLVTTGGKIQNLTRVRGKWKTQILKNSQFHKEPGLTNRQEIFHIYSFPYLFPCRMTLPKFSAARRKNLLNKNSVK